MPSSVRTFSHVFADTGISVKNPTAKDVAYSLNNSYVHLMFAMSELFLFYSLNLFKEVFQVLFPSNFSIWYFKICIKIQTWLLVDI